LAWYWYHAFDGSLVNAHTRATIHPIPDHPKRIFTRVIAVLLRCCLVKAIIVGRIYKANNKANATNTESELAAKAKHNAPLVSGE
jgi:hypothetical protein